jgi:hypothetical protein
MPDDPIQVMPAPLPVTGAFSRDVNQFYDRLRQSHRPKRRSPSPARAVNTLGEVPDSEWFTNRHGARRMSRDELQRGSMRERPTPPFTIVAGKNDGIGAGFTLKDSEGRLYFAKVDPISNPEMATGAETVVSRFLYAIGYNTPQNDIVNVHPSELHVSEFAEITPSNGRSRKMTWWDVEEIIEGAPRCPDGSVRIVASLAIEGDLIGPFLYEGVRRDDPNDIVPHENRRDLRGLFVFSAWLNNTDMRSGNTMDTVVYENGDPFIRHYLLDFGSAIGSDGDRAKRPRSGNRFFLPTPGEALRRIFTLGAVPEKWERADFPDFPAAGNFDSELFEPDKWTSNYPTIRRF